ncbi:MAG: phosphoribosyltransferase family protein [Candidatus Pseudobacter hemicellulosilyticus]|uniref:Phosphoribosyltransferase family protein n=1 Tax=Candidatus Pseudobacter hemicellulosilyticus TaxID=3121375 RepID=A0AAJ5WTS7_9BACT|nr:MAG: phosphoribosyltransferase family protein [Pseudobacter sp.]
MLRHAHQSLVHLFFPRLCAGCSAELAGRQPLLCLSCMDQLPLARFHHYPGNPAEQLLHGRLPLLSAMSYLFFTKNSLGQRLLHQLKYQGRREIAKYFGASMGAALQESGRFAGIDALIPLPLHAARQRQRGFNQAALLGQFIASQLQVPMLPDIISRISGSSSQTRMKRMDRGQQMQGRFRLDNPAAVSGCHLLLVDDVLTTGATLEACGQELLKAPGVRLSIATLAFAAR